MHAPGEGRTLRPTQRLAINGDVPEAERGAEFPHPGAEAFREDFVVERGEHAIDRVVARDAVWQRQDRLEPFFATGRKQMHALKTGDTTNDRAERDDENVVEPMLFGAVEARVG